MPLILPGNVGSATAATGYNVANSVRFDGTSSYMSFAPGSNMNLDRWTWSCWVKRSKLGAVQTIFNCDNAASDLTELQFDANDKLHFDNRVTGGSKGKRVTTRVFRDISAWMHIMVVWDSGNSTANDRIKIYVNGVQETAFDTTDNPDQNTDSSFGESGQPIRIGVLDESSEFFSGYICEAVVLDGTAAAVTDFGEFNSDSPTIWQPIDVSGLTFGSQGFYLDFEDSGDLGDDESGNGNDFTETNLAATDQTTDTCTNNFCTWNSLDTFYSGNTYQEGNTQGTKPNNAVESFGTSTFGISSGKWYVEFKVISFSGSNSTIGFGLIDRPSVRNDMEIGKYTYGITYKNNGGIYANDGGTHSTDTGVTYGAGDIVGLYIDLDNLEFYFAKNGTLLNSGTGFAIQPLSSTINGVYFFGFDNFANGGSVHQANWGNPAFAISSGNQDDNGYGNFEYSPNITGDGVAKKFYALCTKNLAEFG